MQVEAMNEAKVPLRGRAFSGDAGELLRPGPCPDVASDAGIDHAAVSAESWTAPAADAGDAGRTRTGVSAVVATRPAVPEVLGWDCPCGAEGPLGKAPPPRTADTRSRSQFERTLGCGFTRYSCGKSVIVRPVRGGGEYDPETAMAFDAKTGRFIAYVEWGGLAHRGGPHGEWTDCLCDGPTTFHFPNVESCEKKVVSCP
jgi:hypothetical protein